MCMGGVYINMRSVLGGVRARTTRNERQMMLMMRPLCMQIWLSPLRRPFPSNSLLSNDALTCKLAFRHPPQPHFGLPGSKPADEEGYPSPSTCRARR